MSTVLPAAIDTPFFRSGANVTGRQVVPPGPAIDARRVADAIVRTARRPRREVIVGGSTRMGLIGARLSPGAAERISARLVDAQHFTDDPAPRTEGNVLEPITTGADIDGGWRDLDKRSRMRTVLTVGALTTAAAVTARRWLRS